MIWKARSIIRAERRRQNPELDKLATYGQGVIGARRVRAAWEWLAKNDSKKCELLEQRTRDHMSELGSLDLKPHHVDSRPKSVTRAGFMKSIFQQPVSYDFTNLICFTKFAFDNDPSALISRCVKDIMHIDAPTFLELRENSYT